MALPLVCTSRSNLYIRGAHLWHQHHGEDAERLAPQQEGDRAGGHCPDWEEQLEGQAQDKAPKICTHRVCTPSFPWDEQISHETSRLLLCKGSFRASGSFGVNPRSSKVSTALGLPIPTQPRREVSMTCLAGGFQPRSHTNPRLPPMAPQASPDPAPWQGQVWIPAGTGQHQARWESSSNSRTRTMGKERARAGGGQMRKDPQPFGNAGPKRRWSVPINLSLSPCKLQLGLERRGGISRVCREKPLVQLSAAEQLSRETPPNSRSNGAPSSITWRRCESPGQPSQASPAGGDPEQGKGWSRPMVLWWDEHPGAPLQHLGRAME